ncbi:MAG: nitrous oxide reductase family maturation protein NosD [Candidatus Thorarchaeota archaeon]
MIKNYPRWLFSRKSISLAHISLLCGIIFAVWNFAVIPQPLAVNAAPPNGEWLITGTETETDSTYIINGSIVIQSGGSLTLDNTKFRMNSPNVLSPYNITVESGGSLIIKEKSNVTAYNPNFPWFLNAEAGSSVLLNDSFFSDAGTITGDKGVKSGLWFNTTDVEILNCTIKDNLYGLWLYQAEDSIVANNTISDCGGAIHLGPALGYTYQGTKNITISGNIISDCSARGIFLLNSMNSTVSMNNITNGGEQGIYLSSSGDSVIDGNNITNVAKSGVKLASSSNTNVTKNTINKTTGGVTDDSGGIFLYQSADCIVRNNNLTDLYWNGIFVDQWSDNCQITHNGITDVANSYGIFLRNCNTGNISNNRLTNLAQTGIHSLGSTGTITASGNNITNSGNYYGIYLVNPGTAITNNNTITHAVDDGIRVDNCAGTLTANYNNVTGAGVYGIRVYNANSGPAIIVKGNHFLDLGNGGVYVVKRPSSMITDNTITNSSSHGILMAESGSSSVDGNIITNCSSVGIILSSCASSSVNDNVITEIDSRDGVKVEFEGSVTVNNNTISFCEGDGIEFEQASSCTTSNNTVINCTGSGINYFMSGSAKILNNTVTNCTFGIQTRTSGGEKISNNTVVQNNGHGIYLIEDSSGFAISHNYVANNNGTGITIGSRSTGCTIWGNTLMVNRLNGYDNNLNQWDNGSYGNYWDDYAGPDWDLDGFGDWPHSVSGFGNAQDRYPLTNVTYLLLDVTAPTIIPPADIAIEESTKGVNITWSPSDANPLWYNLTLNQVLIEQGVWNGSTITIYLDDMKDTTIPYTFSNWALVESWGVYNFTLRVYDRVGQWASDTVMVNVTDTTPPFFWNTPEDITFMEGMPAGASWSWSVEGLWPNGSWIIYQDGVEIASGGEMYSPGISHEILESLAVGTYNFTVVIFDKAGNSASHTVIVTVTPYEGPPSSEGPSSEEPSSEEPSATSPGFTVLMLLGLVGLVIVKRKQRKQNE